MELMMIINETKLCKFVYYFERCFKHVGTIFQAEGNYGDIDNL